MQETEDPDILRSKMLGINFVTSVLWWPGIIWKLKVLHCFLNINVGVHAGVARTSLS